MTNASSDQIDKRRRFQVGLSYIADLKFSLLSKAIGETKAGKGASIITEYLCYGADWKAACAMLIQEARVKRIPINDLLREKLPEFEDSFPPDSELSCLLTESGDPLNLLNLEVDNSSKHYL